MIPVKEINISLKAGPKIKRGGINIIKYNTIYWELKIFGRLFSPQCKKVINNYLT